jgi:hypothetical protein
MEHLETTPEVLEKKRAAVEHYLAWISNFIGSYQNEDRFHHNMKIWDIPRELVTMKGD